MKNMNTSLIILGFTTVFIIACAMWQESEVLCNMIMPCPYHSIRLVELKATDDYLVSSCFVTTVIDRKLGTELWQSKGWHSYHLENNVIDNETIFLTNGKRIRAVDLGTCKTKWEVNFPSPSKHNKRYVQLIRQGNSLVAADPHLIACYDIKSKNLLWQRELAGHKLALPPLPDNDMENLESAHYLILSTPKRLYANTSKNLLCLNLKTGRKLWQRPNNRALGRTPINTEGVIALDWSSLSIVALSQEGKAQWTHQLPKESQVYYKTAATHDQIITAWSKNYQTTIAAFSAKTGNINWQYGPARGDGVTYKGPTKYIRNWRSLFTSSPIVDNTHVYFYSTDGLIHKIDIKTGQGSKILSLKAPLLSAYPPTFLSSHKGLGIPKSDMTIRDDVLYLECGSAGGYDAKFIALDTNTKKPIWFCQSR